MNNLSKRHSIKSGYRQGLVQLSWAGGELEVGTWMTIQ
jgi:hypothetical protein